MALKSYKPTSPARRGLILVDKSGLWKGKPVKKLVEGKNKTGGRNNKGHVTSRGIAGGHKQKYRLIDFKRRKWDMAATVERLEYDPNRTAFIALLKYEDGELAYIIAPQRLDVGDSVIAGHKTDVKPGNAMLLSQMPVGTIVHNVEMKPGKGGQIARSGYRSPEERRATLPALRLHGDRWRGFQPGQFEPEFRQGRPYPLEGTSSSHPRCCEKPGRSPAWWW